MSTATAAGADAGGLNPKASIPESVFAKSGAAVAADVARSVDQARPATEQDLANTASGPLLMQQTLSVLDTIPDAPFAELCNDGSKITGRNLLGKLARCVLTPIKEVYLPLMTWGLPTNHLMVSQSLTHSSMSEEQQAWEPLNISPSASPRACPNTLVRLLLCHARVRVALAALYVPDRPAAATLPEPTDRSHSQGECCTPHRSAVLMQWCRRHPVMTPILVCWVACCAVLWCYVAADLPHLQPRLRPAQPQRRRPCTPAARLADAGPRQDAPRQERVPQVEDQPVSMWPWVLVLGFGSNPKQRVESQSAGFSSLVEAQVS